MQQNKTATNKVAYCREIKVVQLHVEVIYESMIVKYDYHKTN